MDAQEVTRIPRRTYRDEVELSVVGFGGLAVCGLPQDEVSALVAEAVARGVNWFDVAPMYGRGEAETKLGIALEPHRDSIFLSCKTLPRDGGLVEAELDQTLKRLRTDRVDLYQFHAVNTLEDVEAILAPGGPADVFRAARAAGRVRYFGFSTHGEEAAVTLMDEFECDSVVFPVNFVCWRHGGFGRRIMEHAQRRGVARLAIKALAKERWAKGETWKYPNCWYRPFEDRAEAERALRFTLSQDVTSAMPPAATNLIRLVHELAAGIRPLTEAEDAELRELAQTITPIFG